MDVLLTIDEAIRVLNALEPRRAAQARAEGRDHILSPRQLRYLADARRGVLPALREAGSPYSARYLYRASDLVLIRLLLRVSAHRPAWQAWSALTYLGDAVREAIDRRRAVALVFRGGARAALYPVQAREARTEDAFSIPACSEGVENAIDREIRTRVPEARSASRAIAGRARTAAAGG